MIFAVFYTFVLLALAGTGVFLWKRLSGWNIWERGSAVLAGPLLLNVGVLFFFKIRDALYYTHNWERLQNAFALALGYPIYHTLDQGAILNTIYGPVSVIAYLPATLAQTPFPAMTIAALLTVAYFFLPPLWVHWGEASAGERQQVRAYRDTPLQILALVAFAAFASGALLSSSLRNAAFHIHADSPALGLGVLACGFICFRKKKDGILGLSLSAVFTVLAVWTKQVMAPLPLAIAFYLLFTEGVRVFVRYLLCLLGFGLLLSAIFFYAFGVDGLLLNMILIPSRHSLREGWFLDSLLKLLRECLPALGVAVFSLGPVLWKEWKKKSALAFLRSSRWTLFLITAVFLIPTSILGNGKVGGSNNTLSYTCYFLLLAATFAFVELVREKKTGYAPVVFAGVILLVIQISSVYYRNFHPQEKVNYVQTAYDYIRKNPGKGYFPRLNVLNAMVEKKVYHASVALMDRKWAGLPVRLEHLRAHLPERMEVIAFYGKNDDDKRWIELPGLWVEGTDPALPDFKVYRRKD